MLILPLTVHEFQSNLTTIKCLGPFLPLLVGMGLDLNVCNIWDRYTHIHILHIYKHTHAHHLLRDMMAQSSVCSVLS